MPTAAHRISYLTAPSPVGLILAARDGDAPALVAVLIGEREDELRDELARRFPMARVERDATPDGAALIARVVRAVASPALAGDIPIDPRGTSFQQVVWHALRLIPAGTTTTYTDLARRIGRPRAVRAVAGACAANPVAILVPCHRVVRRDGDLSGYRWGVERKRALLAIESSRRAAEASARAMNHSGEPPLNTPATARSIDGVKRVPVAIA
jgi:AraC family transcriptional regulator of adaptative response/methylated-DNA-[protein]-cysteine methyltransferase